MKYSDYFIDSLVKLGYTHCFFVGGGNVMHLLESARTRLTCIAVVHEMSAGIAAEYFNVAHRDDGHRAFALVTAGPGITNLATAIGGAWLESRELLVIGGQARTEFISHSEVRQIGHQQIDGRGIVAPMTKWAATITEPMTLSQLRDITEISKNGRKGPVFIEMCLDVTAMEIVIGDLESKSSEADTQLKREEEAENSGKFQQIIQLIKSSSRPLFLVGGGMDFLQFNKMWPEIEALNIPIATTWNACDYVDFDHELYAGRPNTYGMRWANAIIQQADLVITFGARLGLQQTGFAWDQFVPEGKIVRIDLDKNEINLRQPKTFIDIEMDAADSMRVILDEIRISGAEIENNDWLEFIHQTQTSLPLVEQATYQYDGFVNPFQLVSELSSILMANDKVISCSSGGSYTSMMQVFEQKKGQLLTNNKGLASMGYGLAGAIGTAIAFPESRTILVEGDGGFAQNLSELGTVQNRKLNMKIFIFSNTGYASIRVSQKAYFNGAYIGCDAATGVGLPEWEQVFAAYSIPSVTINGSLKENATVIELLDKNGPAAFIVNLHPDQSFLPKVTSKIFSDGKMKSNPIHLMQPELPDELAQQVFKFLPENLRK
jgi:acetolactate synthase I/II/III large subunit